MPNSFLKDIQIAWEKMVEGFEDALVMSKNISKYTADAKAMERSNNVLWIPQPYILPSHDGSDQTGKFQDQNQLAVPVTIGNRKSVTWAMSDTELLDDMQEGRLGEAAYQRLASDINVAVLDVASTQGTIVQVQTAAASNFGDVASIRTALNRVGVGMPERYLSLSSDDYNGLAKDLANRATMTGKPETAYQSSYVGRVAGLETFEMDYALSQAAALGGAGLTMSTLAQVNSYVPVPIVVGATGLSPVDNRFQTITISSTTNVLAGDCFTIAGINEVHHITKRNTGRLKTFRVIGNPLSATTMVISPPIISNPLGATLGSEAEIQYQNCINITPSATAAIVFINTVAAPVNPFWQKNAIVLTPGRMAPPTDSGVMIKRAVTENGIEITMWKQADIKTAKALIRVDVRFGVTMLQPEMAGIKLFGQT